MDNPSHFSMALPAPPRLLLLSTFLLSFCVSELASAPTSFGPTDASRLSFSSMSSHPWKSASANEGLRYQYRSILNPLRLQAARDLTEVAGEPKAREIRFSNPETGPTSDAEVRVKIGENAREQMDEKGVIANEKLIQKRMLKKAIGQKPTTPNSLDRSEGANASRVTTDAQKSLPSESAGEAQDDEKANTKKVDRQGVVPVGKGQRGPSSGDSRPIHFEHEEAHMPPPHLPPIIPDSEIGGAAYPAGNPAPDTKRDDTKKSAKGTENKRDPDTRKDDVVKQTKGTEVSDSQQDSSAKQSNECEESHCQDADKVLSACLRTSGEGNHMLSLSITNEGDDNVTANVLTPKFLRADPPQMLVKKGAIEMVQIFMDLKTEARLLDLEGAKSRHIGINSVHGECQIEIPMEYLRSSTRQGHLSYSSLHTPMAGIYVLLLLVVMIAGIWMYCRYQGRKRFSDGVKYQELEMNVSGVGTPKERMPRSGGESNDGWDQVWDDDWEDTEAVRSSPRLSQSLSSSGLAARRANKDGRDSN